jgi:ABC-type multidrug transport system permease subunit
MPFLWISALKDLRRLRREPTTLLTWLAIPAFLVIILTLVFGPRGSGPHGALLIADQDGGPGGMLLTRAFSEGALGKILTVAKVTETEGRRRMDRGEASALLIIPTGFTAGFMQSKPVTLALVRNPAQRILPDIIEEALAIATESASSPAGIARRPVIELNATIIPNKGEQPGGFAAILLPGALFMAVFFLAGALAADVWRERSSGALRRIATTPASLGAFLGGKVLAAALVFAAIGAFGLLVAHRMMDLRVASFPGAVLWIAASGCGLYLNILPLQALATSERVAALLTNFITMPLVMLGGGFVPFEWMPNSLANIGRWTPNGWSVMQLRGILAGSIEPRTVVYIALFLAFAWFINVQTIRRTAC